MAINKLNIYLIGPKEIREMIGTLGIAIQSKNYYCCIGMVVAPSFTYYARRESTRSPHPIKLSIVNDKKKKNNIVKDLRDFVDLNLCTLVKKEGVIYIFVGKR